jgi:hypothetical protein
MRWIVRPLPDFTAITDLMAAQGCDCDKGLGGSSPCNIYMTCACTGGLIIRPSQVTR